MTRVRVYDYVNQPFRQVAEVLARDPSEIIRRATTAAGERASELDARLHARVGPIDVSVSIDIDIGPIDLLAHAYGNDAIRIPLAWRAPPRRLAFPDMQATLTIFSLTSTE